MNNTVTKKQIDKIVKNSEIDVKTVFDKCTVVTMRLPNGFILTESSACVDPKNYDVKLGERVCKEKLINKIWELEGYRLQNELHSNAEKPQYLNCKICITTSTDDDLTVGKIYDIVDGKFKDNTGEEYPFWAKRIKDIEELREYIDCATFVKVVG